jgi:hypothetical protein
MHKPSPAHASRWPVRMVSLNIDPVTLTNLVALDHPRCNWVQHDSQDSKLSPEFGDTPQVVDAGGDQLVTRTTPYSSLSLQASE